MRPIDEIIVHCTDTLPEWWAGRRTSQKVAEVRRWHVTPEPAGRGWSDIGYHYLIDRDGTVAKGRPLERTGAHVAGHNTGTIGISLFGGHGSSADDAFDDNFTQAQDRALRDLIASLRKQFPTIRKVTGHNEYAAKACPGFRVADWLDDAPMSSPAVVHQVGGGPLSPKPVDDRKPADAGTKPAQGFWAWLLGWLRGKA
jgi:N-acetylmuramoyl-L-alanine amidase